MLQHSFGSMHAISVSSDEKRQALNQILRSVTFRRSDQLRQFLAFVVEEEIAGRGAEIRESDVAVRALHKPETYSPETDSTVRTRAHALRQKLAEFYQTESPGEEIRIELPKGGYTPRFYRWSEAVPAATDPLGTNVVFPAEAPAGPGSPPATALAGGSRGRHLLLGLTAGIAIATALVAWAFTSRRIQLHSSVNRPVSITEAWGPILQSSSPVRVVMGSPPQLWVRDYGENPTPLVDPVQTPPMAADPELLRWYAENMTLLPTSKLYLHTNSAGALWGDAAGVQVATKFLTENGVPNELVPEKSLKSGYVFRNDSFLAFGRSEYSPLMNAKLPQSAFDVKYLPKIRRHAIALRSNPENGPIFLPTFESKNINYGLITVIRETADDGRQCQAMLFAGVISNGAQAAIEFMTTPRHLEELGARFRAAGLTSWPRAFQVVVRTETNQFYPLRTDYETHLILQK